MTVIDWCAIALYFVLLVIIGLQTIRKVGTSEDFAVAGNRIIWPIMFATLAAAFIGGGASLGRAGESFTNGYSFMFAASAFSIQTVLVGYFAAPRLKRYTNAQTVGDIMDEHYGRKARLLTGILSVIFCAGILGSQALAIGTVFSTLLGMSTTLGILIGMGIVLLYSTTGGFWAVTHTDVLQFVFLGIFVPIVVILGVNAVGGPGGLVRALPADHFSFLGTYTIGAFLSIFLSFLLGETLVPPYTQRALSTPDAASARKGYTVAGIFSILFYFMSASVGLIALVLFPNVSPDQAFPTVVKELLPVGITGLVVAALLAVVMSTASSYLNATAVVFVKDIYQPFINPGVSDSGRLWLQRLITLIVGGAAIIFAFAAPSIVDALLYSYALWAPTIIIPLLLAVVGGFRGEVAALSAMISGGVITAVWTWALKEPYGVSGLVAGIVVNILVFIVAYNMFDRKGQSTVVDRNLTEGRE